MEGSHREGRGKEEGRNGKEEKMEEGLEREDME